MNLDSIRQIVLIGNYRCNLTRFLDRQESIASVLIHALKSNQPIRCTCSEPHPRLQMYLEGEKFALRPVGKEKHHPLCVFSGNREALEKKRVRFKIVEDLEKQGTYLIQELSAGVSASNKQGFKEWDGIESVRVTLRYILLKLLASVQLHVWASDDLDYLNRRRWSRIRYNLTKEISHWTINDKLLLNNLAVIDRVDLSPNYLRLKYPDLTTFAAYKNIAFHLDHWLWSMDRTVGDGPLILLGKTSKHRALRQDGLLWTLHLKNLPSSIYLSKEMVDRIQSQFPFEFYCLQNVEQPIRMRCIVMVKLHVESDGRLTASDIAMVGCSLNYIPVGSVIEAKFVQELINKGRKFRKVMDFKEPSRLNCEIELLDSGETQENLEIVLDGAIHYASEPGAKWIWDPRASSEPPNIPDAIGSCQTLEVEGLNSYVVRQPGLVKIKKQKSEVTVKNTHE